MIKFDSLGLSENILSAIQEIGFETPTPVQQQTIPVILSNDSDLVALAQTGTGKTAAFALPLLELIDSQSSLTQAIVLCPTRELCRQIFDDVVRFSSNLKGLKPVAVYGGASIGNQIRDVKRGSQLIIGTPGRVRDLIERSVLDLSTINYVVLDEADEMLNMGFKDEIEFILSSTPETRRTFLFSATMPKEVKRISGHYMNNPTEVSVSDGKTTARNITHSYCLINASDRIEALTRILDFHTDAYSIIFCRTRKETQDVSDHLGKRNFAADCLHGDLSQAQRDHVMKRFRNRNITILVATDVAARGLDIDDIRLVVHFQLPDEPESYVHRSGRTARAGKSGESVALTSRRDLSKIHSFEKHIGSEIKRIMIPGGNEIIESKLIANLERLNHQNTEINLPEVVINSIREMAQNVSTEELFLKYLSLVNTNLSDRYQNAPDINVTDSPRRNDKKDRPKKSERSFDRDRDFASGSNGGSFTRFHINLGKKDNLNPNRLMGFINEYPELKGCSIGRIEILKTFSFFEISERVSDQVEFALGGEDFHGRKVQIQPADSKKNFKKASRSRNSFGGNNSYAKPAKDFKNHSKSKKKKQKDFAF
ncbi:MAG: DEAD/DEAH box helicase [Bacteroidetes bacterium]|nr:DEAD/DEAH box helicase [Bacteroidota bacterium]